MACIGIDCRFASLPVGIGTYTRNIVPRLLENLQGHHCVLFVRDKDPWESTLPANTTRVCVQSKHYSLREQFELPFRVKQTSCDLFFCPHFNVPLRLSIPFIATIHDLILHRYPNKAPVLKQWGYKAMMKRTVEEARHIIAVSAFTASEIESVYGRTHGVTVVPEGVEEQFRPISEDTASSTLQHHGIAPGYFLYVGGAKEHKNVQTLIDAHRKLGDGSSLVLVISGIEASALTLHPGVTILPNIETRDLPALYSAARCFVTPSLYEGFCLPILEARACGCPIIASNRTAIPEVTGSGAVLIDPTVNALAAALKEPPTAAEPVQEHYNWDTAASTTAAILENVLHG